MTGFISQSAATKGFLRAFVMGWALTVSALAHAETFDFGFTNNLGSIDGTVTGQVVFPSDASGGATCGTGCTSGAATAVTISSYPSALTPPAPAIPPPTDNLVTNPAVTVVGNNFASAAPGSLGFPFGRDFYAAWGTNGSDGGLILAQGAAELATPNGTVYSNGGATFVSTTAHSFESVISGAVTVQVASPIQLTAGLSTGPTVQVNPNLVPTQITASFAPNFGYSLSQAALLGGFKEFDWVQIVTVPPPSPYKNIFNDTLVGKFNDPALGGYPAYMLNGNPQNNSYPFYYNANTAASDVWSVNSPLHNNGNTLTFFDQPSDSCLQGGSGCLDANNVLQFASSPLYFATDLVGVNFDGTYQILAGFDWTSNATCQPLTRESACGDVFTLNTLYPLDLGNDEIGGVTLLDAPSELNSTPLPPSWILFLSALAALGAITWRNGRTAIKSCVRT